MGVNFDVDYEYISVCSNIKEESVFPITDHHGDTPTRTFRLPRYLIFITFHCYSSGFIDLSYTRDEACFGENFAISRGPSCNNFEITWRDREVTGPFNSGFKSDKKHICTDVWLLNNIIKVETSPFENCSFVLDHLRSAFLVGRFKMIISALFATNSSFNNIATDMSLLGYTQVEMDVYKDLAIPTATENVNFSIPLSTQHIDYFDPSIFTVFRVTYLGSLRFPIFAIRVQFIEQVICSDDNSDQFGLYRTTYIIEDILDVFLPRNRPYKVLSDYILRYDGYNRGTCRARMPGHKCSQSSSHYEIVRMHYHPHESLVMPHEIDISVKKTDNCSFECSLDIGILEYMHINYTRRSWYHEWRRIYQLTWQVIAVKSRGFIVTTNLTCAACRKLCDIAVALGLPLTSSHMLDSTPTPAKYLDVLNGYFKDYGIKEAPTYDLFEHNISSLHISKHVVTSSNHVYGNWYDANAYCAARNTSLVAYIDLLNQLTDLIGSVDSDHGWKKSQGHYFAGFRRDGLVSDSDLIIT